MEKEFHILNGDSLNEFFPKSLLGDKLIVRECLCDGEVCGDTLDDFYHTRSSFISKLGDFVKEDYYELSVKEFTKIKNLPKGSTINLWFEEDVFCQVNFWFVINLLEHHFEDCTFYLVLPKKKYKYSFASMNEDELLEAFSNKISLFKVELEEISSLWQHFKSNDLNTLKQLALDLEDRFPFIFYAVDAIIDDKKDNRVLNSIKDIVKQFGKDDFSKVFKEFQNSQAIYGYGDLQVKKLLQTI